MSKCVEEDLKLINNALNIASSERLEAEVILWAFYAIQSNPQLSIEEALEAGLEEWDL